MLCRCCGSRTCAFHQMPADHYAGQTCEEFGADVNPYNLNGATLATYQWEVSQIAIQKRCKRCPRCGVMIEKDGGCDTMRCKYSPNSDTSIIWLSTDVSRLSLQIAFLVAWGGVRIVTGNDWALLGLDNMSGSQISDTYLRNWTMCQRLRMSQELGFTSCLPRCSEFFVLCDSAINSV